MAKSDSRWFQVRAMQGGSLLAEVLVVGYRDAQVDARRLRATYPAATVTMERAS